MHRALIKSVFTCPRSSVSSSALRLILTPTLRHSSPPSSSSRYSSSSLSAQSSSAYTQRCCCPRHFSSGAGDVPIVVPPIAESIKDGKLVAFTKAVGDSVALDEVIASLETDKVTVDIRASSAGVIMSLIGKPGDNIDVGATIATIKEGATGSSSSSKSASKLANTPDQASSSSSSSSSPSSPVHPTPPKPQQSAQPQQPLQHLRTPMIRFRFGIRDPAPSTLSSTSSSSPLLSPEEIQRQQQAFICANDAAYAAWQKLPQYYKRRPLPDVDMDCINLGGASNYQPKTKAKGGD